MSYKLRFLGIVAVLAGLVFLLGGRDAFAEQEGGVPNAKSSLRDTQIVVEMQAPPVLALGQPLEFTISVHPLIDAPDVALRWVVPEGVVLLGGPLEENLGMLVAGQTVTLVRQVQIDSAGTHKIGVEATFQPLSGVHFGDAAVLYLTVDGRGGSVTDKDPQRIARLRERIPLGPDAGVTVSAASAQPSATDDTCFDVSATFTRKDKVWAGGTTQLTNIIPLTSATIEIWEDDLVFDDLMGTTKPDANGEIAWSTCDDDGLFDDDLEVYLAVASLVEGPDGGIVGALETAPPLWIDLPDLPFSDDGLYVFETSNMNIGSSGTLRFGTVELNDEMSAAINIVETMYEAWRFWNANDNDPDREEFDIVDVYWSQGGGHGTYYVAFLDNLYIDGEPDPDEWDDTVIIHEWAHFADDKWGCDDNPGGDHDGIGLVDSKLAWGEGYPDFYQMVVRANEGEPFAEWYVDLNALGGCSVCFNIETWDTTHPNSLSPNNELAIAAALWDLIDTNNDGQDLYTMAEGYPFIQEVFLSSAFVDANIGNCDFVSFLQSWQALGGPTDAGAAAAITQNTLIAQVFGSAATVASVDGATQTVAHNAALTEPMNERGYGWWERVAYIVDNSQSMAGVRLDAIKEVLQEQVDDLFEDTPQGVELRMDTFNNTSTTNQKIFAGKFYPDDVKPAIAGVSATAAADTACPIDAFGALKQTVAGESNLNTWLFTDGYPAVTASPLENFRAELVNRDISASFAVLQTVGGGARALVLVRRQKLSCARNNFSANSPLRRAARQRNRRIALFPTC